MENTHRTQRPVNSPKHSLVSKNGKQAHLTSTPLAPIYTYSASGNLFSSKGSTLLKQLPIAAKNPCTSTGSCT